MMMAHDMSPTPPSLDDETISALRNALAQYVREGERSSQLGKTLHRVAAEAHEKQISAEHLLIILKNLWSSLPEVRDMEKATEREKLKQKIVTACIAEYYRK
jgi:hemoglobin-like flavoprotein